MDGIWQRLHGFGVRMTIPPALIFVQSSSAKGPHPRTTMLPPDGNLVLLIPAREER